MFFSFKNYGLAVATIVAAGTALGQAIEPPPPSIGIEPPVPSEAAPAATRAGAATQPASPTAESVFEDLLRQRNNGTVQNPGSPAGAGGAAGGVGGAGMPALEIGSDGLLREGQRLSGRTGKLKRDPETGATMVVIEGELGLVPMAAVPSRRLELMENAAGFGDGKGGLDLVFPIDAEITQYRGKNYLLIGQSATPLPRPAVAATAPATMPATIAGVLPDPKLEPVAPNAPAMMKIGEGEMIEQRVGRFVKDPKTGAQYIVFDGDGKRMLDQPMGLLPSKFLALMEDASEFGMKPVKFRVSGEITQYRGKNYLYLRSVTIIRDIKTGIGG